MPRLGEISQNVRLRQNRTLQPLCAVSVGLSESFLHKARKIQKKDLTFESEFGLIHIISLGAERRLTSKAIYVLHFSDFCFTYQKFVYGRTSINGVEKAQKRR